MTKSYTGAQLRSTSTGLAVEFVEEVTLVESVPAAVEHGRLVLLKDPKHPVLGAFVRSVTHCHTTPSGSDTCVMFTVGKLQDHDSSSQQPDADE